MEYKKGDIIFFEWKSFASKIIQTYNLLKYGQKGPTHIGIIGDIQGEDVLIYEAIAKGFTKSWYPIEFLEREQYDHKRAKLLLKNIQENLEKYIGKPYGWLSILSLGLSWFFRFKIDINLSNSVICSEATAKFLYDSSNKKINIADEYNKPYQLITPFEVYYSQFLK